MSSPMPLPISFDDFTKGKLDSLSWYDFGVKVPVFIVDTPALAVALQVQFLGLPTDALLQHLQVLSAQGLNGHLTGLDLTLLKALAFQSSQVMSRELTVTGDRQLRMWAQRLNYTLQPLICAAEPVADLTGLLGEEVLDGNKPWDALTRGDEMVWITSDPENLHIRNGTDVRHMQFNLPTQLDMLGGGAMSVGSLYSPGASILQPDGQRHDIAHDTPVLVVFDWVGRRCLLDTRARICDAETGKVLHKAPCQQLHFARVFGTVAYLLNNGDFGQITLVDLQTGAITRQPVLPVQVCNDIAVTQDRVYLIDKQQGAIFSFDRDWRYVDHRLSFGTGRGQLADPVSLRATQQGLACVSWLSHKRTEISFF